ncbi:four-helix bundle copper-binding protein [Scytonema sp. UIC 10036]|uniref:four-helix bundle copper-binding protein n=1 Tax=Scytonema sp. UIC 10036 TaxID=2304196 RepID=UPI0012DAA3D5|nr:four-helix bundle copper-binding protein [Scytonema sp. UIC 10036]MUG96908.1 four-helix bundle copper-binding protein [Scytonema sp. UIC 10036]
MTQTQLHQVNPQMQLCIQACLDCHSTCLNTITYCLQEGGQHAAAAHIALMLDCAEICQTSANFMLRGSALHMRTCGVCAEVCDICAMDCQRFADDAQMQACVEMCRRCAESCRQMAMVKA